MPTSACFNRICLKINELALTQEKKEGIEDNTRNIPSKHA